MAHVVIRALILAGLWGWTGCGTAASEPAGDAGAGAKPVTPPPQQGYRAQVVFHGGAANGLVLTLDRDLTSAVKTSFSFGSSHLQPPAISLVIQDGTTIPVGGVHTQVEFLFQFGTLVPSAVNPAMTPQAGGYPFSCNAPMLTVYFKGANYQSICPGVGAGIQVDQWAAEEGGRFTGRFKGKLQSVWPASQDDCAARAAACDASNVWADIEGEFGFTLPAPDGGGA